MAHPEHLAVVINTHVDSGRALDHLLDSMRRSRGFVNTPVIVCEGGHFAQERDYVMDASRSPDANVVRLRCNHNSIDYTGLIALVEAFSADDRQCYFYMHDTCRVGPSFFEALRACRAAHPGLTSMALASPSMNMGFYSAGTLFEHRELVLAQKNRDPLALQRWKAHGVRTEDCVFKADPTCVVVSGLSSASEPTDYYGTGVQRIVERYDFLDLWKMKANFRGFCCQYELKN